MSRKREDGAGPPSWGADRAMRAAAASLLHADDETIAARALELGFDERRLRAHVVDARRRLPAG